MTKTLLLIMLLSPMTQAMEHVNPAHKHRHSRSREIVIHVDERGKTDSEDNESCQSSGKHTNLKLAIVSALAGLAASAITAGVTLAVHFTECYRNNTSS
jgi:hypothetical protein